MTTPDTPAAPCATDYTPEEDKFFRDRLIRDYDYLIEDFERSSATMGETFAMFITPMNGKLIAAALRTAREEQLAKAADSSLGHTLAAAEGRG